MARILTIGKASPLAVGFAAFIIFAALLLVSINKGAVDTASGQQATTSTSEQ